MLQAAAVQQAQAAKSRGSRRRLTAAAQHARLPILPSDAMMPFDVLPSWKVKVPEEEVVQVTVTATPMQGKEGRGRVGKCVKQWEGAIAMEAACLIDREMRGAEANVMREEEQREEMRRAKEKRNPTAPCSVPSSSFFLFLDGAFFCPIRHVCVEER